MQDIYKFSRPLLVTFASLLLSACASHDMQPLKAYDQPIQIDRFMGPWYVIGSIPVTIPGFSEAGAHNGMESYELSPDGTILTTYTFRKDAFNGKEKRFTPKGWVYNNLNTEWRMQFVWPFKAAYLIAWVDADYQETIVAVPNRKYIWIMSRNWQITDERYSELVKMAADMGYDTSLIKRIPQQW
ncbi:MAG: lipocalin family protein [Gammaproteobacteria bacterium]|nr:lipocalin family protein [Gammaproteobacteria bacterium]